MKHFYAYNCQNLIDWEALKRAEVEQHWPHTQKMHLFAGGVLGDGFGALAQCVLSQLTGQEQTSGGLDLPGGDGATLVVVGKTASLGRDVFKDVINEGVHDRHVFEGNTASVLASKRPG